MSSNVDELFELESTTLALNRKERVRCDLISFSEELMRQLPRYERESDCKEASRILATLFNNAALVQFQAGEIDRAEALCHHAILLYGTAKESSPHWLASIIQPYINLGRVAAARGYGSQSVELYANMIRLLEDGQPLLIDRFLIGASEFSLILEHEPSIRNVIVNVYVSDSVKAFLISKDYEGLIAFLDHIEATPWLTDSSYRFSIAKEARARALLGLERYNGALKTLDDLNRELSRQGTPQLAVYALISDIYRRCHRPGQAKTVLDFIEKQVSKMLSAGVAKLAPQPVVYLLALGQYSVQEYDRAYANAVNALEMASELRDEVGTLKCLMLLYNITCQWSPPDGAGENISWQAELRQLARRTCYRFERAIALLQLSNGPSYERQAVVRDKHETTLDDLSESFALLTSLPLAGCDRWRQRVVESMRRLQSSTATEWDHLEQGRIKPDVPEIITTLYETLTRFDCIQTRGIQKQVASALAIN